MNPDQYLGILARHELAAFDHVKRRVGSQAMLAAQELSDIETDIMLHQLSDEEYAALRAQENDINFVPAEYDDPVQDAQISFHEEVLKRFGDIDGYLLSFADPENGLSLLKMASEKEDGLLTNYINLGFLYSRDGAPQITKTRRASTHSGEKIKESLTVNDEDNRILDEAFSRLSAINEALRSE